MAAIIKPGSKVSSRLKSVKLDDSPTPLKPKSIRIHSSSVPVLQEDQQYKAQFTSAISAPGQLPIANLASSQTFTVAGNPYALDAKEVHTVFPPSGHADYSSMWSAFNANLVARVGALRKWATIFRRHNDTVTD